MGQPDLVVDTCGPIQEYFILQFQILKPKGRLWISAFCSLLLIGTERMNNIKRFGKFATFSKLKIEGWVKRTNYGKIETKDRDY